jgi:hypothetical protein
MIRDAPFATGVASLAARMGLLATGCRPGARQRQAIRAAGRLPTDQQKKPELLQARVESTMEAVEETIGAKAFSLGWQFSAELCCAAIFFL